MKRGREEIRAEKEERDLEDERKRMELKKIRIWMQTDGEVWKRMVGVYADK